MKYTTRKVGNDYLVYATHPDTGASFGVGISAHPTKADAERAAKRREVVDRHRDSWK